MTGPNWAALLIVPLGLMFLLTFVLYQPVLLLRPSFQVQLPDLSAKSFSNLSAESSRVTKANVLSCFEQYRQCVLDGVFEAGKSQMWNYFKNVTDHCENVTSLVQRMNLTGLPNSDETKYFKGFSSGKNALKPDDECNIITLGIGHDVQSEVKLKAMIPKQCRFSGADPIPDVNQAEYEKVGKYYQIAVAASDGMKTASILGYNGSNSYQDVNMTHMHFLKFLTEHVKVKRVIDLLLVDNELAEYDMLPFFLPGGLLDRRGFIVCQWNCEFHGIDYASRGKFSDFTIKNLVAGKYLPTRLVSSVNIRVVFLNVRDELCLKRYWNEFL